MAPVEYYFSEKVKTLFFKKNVKQPNKRNVYTACVRKHPKNIKSQTLCCDGLDGKISMFMNKISDNLSIIFPSVISSKFERISCRSGACSTSFIDFLFVQSKFFRPLHDSGSPKQNLN